MSGDKFWFYDIREAMITCGNTLEEREELIQDIQKRITDNPSIDFQKLTTSDQQVLNDIVNYYEQLLESLSEQKETVRQELQKLKTPQKKVYSYIQREEQANFIDVDL